MANNAEHHVVLMFMMQEVSVYYHNLTQLLPFMQEWMLIYVTMEPGVYWIEVVDASGSTNLAMEELSIKIIRLHFK